MCSGPLDFFKQNSVFPGFPPLPSWTTEAHLPCTALNDLPSMVLASMEGPGVLFRKLGLSVTRQAQLLEKKQDLLGAKVWASTQMPLCWLPLLQPPATEGTLPETSQEVVLRRCSLHARNLCSDSCPCCLLRVFKTSIVEVVVIVASRTCSCFQSDLNWASCTFCPVNRRSYVIYEEVEGHLRTRKIVAEDRATSP